MADNAITVTGHAERTVAPDIAAWRLTIAVTDASRVWGTSGARNVRRPSSIASKTPPRDAGRALRPDRKRRRDRRLQVRSVAPTSGGRRARTRDAPVRGRRAPEPSR